MKIFTVLLFIISLTNINAGIYDLLFLQRDTTSIKNMKITELNELDSAIRVLNKSNKSFPDSLNLPYLIDCAKNFIIDPEYGEAAFYKYDLNGDGKEDLIFNGEYGPPEKIFIVWQNIGDRYDFICSFPGEIKSIIQNSDLNPPSFILESGNCCANFIYDIAVISPCLVETKLNYEIKVHYKYINILELPDGIKNITPIRFRTTTDKYRLRSAPSIIDTLDTERGAFEGQDVYGTIISEFVEGSEGVAIASYVDAEEKVWWFVIMNTDAKVYYNRFYDDKNAYKCGWMSSRYLSQIDN